VRGAAVALLLVCHAFQGEGLPMWQGAGAPTVWSCSVAWLALAPACATGHGGEPIKARRAFAVGVQGVPPRCDRPRRLLARVLGDLPGRRTEASGWCISSGCLRGDVIGSV